MSKQMTCTVYSDPLRRRAYFAAANSTQGFVFWYERLFRGRASRLYVIKGGPGTGKSRLMWDMVGAAHKAGWQTELYFCSSDPTSLDAVRVCSDEGQSIVFLDGTAPHVMEVQSPGFAEQMIDLGAFWSQSQLREHSEEISHLMQQKGKCYAAAYHYLAAAGLCAQNAQALLTPAIRQNAIHATVKRLLSGVIGKKATASAQSTPPHCIFTSALGMRGWSHLDTLERAAKRICLLPECHGAEYMLIEEIVRRGVAVGALMTVSYHPLFPSQADAVLFEESGVLFTTHQSAAQLSDEDRYLHTLSLRRMLDSTVLREGRTAWRQAKRSCNHLLLAAQESLLSAAAPHFALEEIYSAAMDFSAKEAYTAHLAEQLFGK